MNSSRLLIVLGLLLLLLLGGAAGGYWYLFGANSISADELVPSSTIALAAIPNGASLAAGYQTSQLKTLLESPNTQPVLDALRGVVGQKTLDLLQAFAPNLSGQSFVAVTHFDADHPETVGLVAAMKPKPGLGDFDGFVDKLKAAWPDALKQGTTGTGSVAGYDYQWIRGPGAPDKICVAKIGGWIVTTWGEASLQDWIERYEKKAATPSLAKNPDYQKSISRIGAAPMTVFYIDYHAALDYLQKQMAKSNPAAAAALADKISTLGGAALGTSFENGEIVDRFSLLIPKQLRLDSGANAVPCPFDTLKFTGPTTRFYWAFGLDWKQYFKYVLAQVGSNGSSAGTALPTGNAITSSLQSLAQGAGLDLQHNVIDPLGSEVSIQSEWGPDATFPELGLFIKLDKPDDFRPTIRALVEAARQIYVNTAVINELTSNGHKYASLNFVQSSPFSPTLTEDGDYLGIFMTANQAVRSFQRDESVNLAHNSDFVRQVGDKRNRASQVIFLDSPRLLDRGYRSVLPYLSLASMFNKDLAAMLKDRNLPPDLTWLTPMGTWSLVITPDDDGITGYSASGIGNQGIFAIGALGAASSALQSLGILPKGLAFPAASVPAANPIMASPPIAPTPAPPLPGPSGATVPPAADTNAMTSPSAPPSTTNAVPETTPATNAAPAPTH